jgi:hypothetical protein
MDVNIAMTWLPGPNKKATEVFIQSFKKASVSGRILFIPIMETFRLTTYPEVKSLLLATSLLSLAYTGLPTLGWLERASETLKMNHLYFLQHCASGVTIHFIRQFLAFQKNLTATRKATKLAEKTWIYCKLFEDTALSQFSCKSHPETVALFIALTDNLDHSSSIWRIPSLSTYIKDEMKTYAINYASALREYLQTNKADKQLTPLTTSITTLMKTKQMRGALRSVSPRYLSESEEEEDDIVQASGLKRI